jgi:hypothetical protein
MHITQLQALETAFSEQRQAIEHMAQLLSAHTEHQAPALQAQRTEIEALLAAHTREGSDALGAVHQNGAADRAAVTHYSEQPAEKRPRQATKRAPAPPSHESRRDSQQRIFNGDHAGDYLLPSSFHVRE